MVSETTFDRTDLRVNFFDTKNGVPIQFHAKDILDCADLIRKEMLGAPAAERKLLGLDDED